MALLMSWMAVDNQSSYGLSDVVICLAVTDL